MKKLILFTFSLIFTAIPSFAAVTPSTVWVSTFNGTSNNDDVGYGIAVSSSGGNVFVVGYTSQTGTNEDILVAKYNKNGVLQWSVKQDSSGLKDVGYSIAVDSNGSSYITGMVTTAKGQSDILIEKLNSDGTTSWRKTINLAGGANEGRKLIVPSTSYIYVAGIVSQPTSGRDMYVAKLNSTGTVIWQKTYSSSFNATDEAYGVDTDVSGNVYVSGKVFNRTKTSYDSIVLKYNSTGTLLWTSIYNTGSNNISLGTDIKVDSSGNIYSCGAVWNSDLEWDIFIRKLNSSGQVLSTTIQDGGRNDAAFNITSDTNSFTYIAGYEQQATGTYSILARKMNFSAVTQWSIRYSAFLVDIGRGIAVDGNTVYVVGQTNRVDLNQGLNVFIGKFQ